MSNESENQETLPKKYRVRVYIDHFFDVTVEADNEDDAIEAGAEMVVNEDCTWFDKDVCGIIWDACEATLASE